MTTILKMACLRFDSGFHLGVGRGDTYEHSATVLQSDTLSGALCSIHAQMGATDIEDFLGSFSVSSAMPLYEGRLFLPLPPDKSCITMRGDDPMLKRLKRLQWIEQPLWEQLARDGSIEIDADMISGCGLAVAQTGGKDIVVLKSFLEQRVSVAHNGDDATPYFFDRVFAGRGVEFGILYRADDEQAFRQAFTALADTGIGTGRTVGNGQFEVDFREIGIEVPDDSEYCQLLSLWIPSEDEIADFAADNSYCLTSRGGYIAGSTECELRNIEKKSVCAIDVGAVVRGKSLKGSIVDLRPDGIDCHHVWRDGRAFVLPFKRIADYGK